MLFVPAPVYPPYEIMRDDKKAIVIKINPAEFQPTLTFRNPLSPNTTISFTTNYSWKQNPIGYVMNERVFKNSLLNPKYDIIRPCLCFDSKNIPSIISGKKVTQRKKLKLDIKLIVQAGPTLVSNGKIFIDLKREKFRSDVAHNTRQVSVGVTQNKKIIVIYSYSWSLHEIAKYLISVNCVNAIKFDGGGMASLRFKPHPNDKSSPHRYVGNHGVLPVFVGFYPTLEEEFKLYNLDNTTKPSVIFDWQISQPTLGDLLRQ